MHYAAAESIVVGYKRSLVRDVACFVPKQNKKSGARESERETRFSFRINYDMTRHQVFARDN